MANHNNKKVVKNPDPMSNSKTMGREGMRIIKDIAFGRFNIYNNGHVFRNLEFINATMAEVDKRLVEASIHVQAVRFAYKGSDDPAVLSTLMRDEKTYEAYALIRQVLSSIIMSNGDIGFLWVLASKLPNYKYNI